MINNLKIYLFSILALVIFVAGGCKSSKDFDTTTPSITEEAYKALDNALLWKVSGKNLSSPSYVFGTIHIIGKDDYFLPDGTLSAIEKSQNIYFEIDMNEMTDLTAQMSLLKEVFMKDNKTLKDLVTAEDYKMIESHFKEMGLPIFMLERMKPMFLTVFTSGDVDIGGLQSGSMKSYEMELFDIAKRTDKTVGGLETMEFQMSMFDTIPYDVQADMLVESIKAAEGGSDQFQQMVEMYKTQNISAMVSMIGEDESMGDYDHILVDMRNLNWIPIMARLMEESATFFAVGAGHLAGKNGVLPLLMKEGYHVTPIKTLSDIN